MTEEERARLIEAKQGVTERLAAAFIPRYRLADADPRLEEYVTDVAARPEAHNLWEQLAVERFLRMTDRYGIDVTEVRRIIAFYEFLHFPGKRGLTRYRLTPVQLFQFASIYGFRTSDGRRLVREAVLYVPRKYSKTTQSATFILYDLLYGDANAECYTGANSQDQARKCFDVIRSAVRRLDPVGKRFIVNKEMIRPTARNPRQALAQCLTANARTKDGLNASTVVMDEFSQARDSELLTVLTTSMGVRENPLTVIITTASDVFDGPFHSMLEGYKGVLLGDWEDDTLFAHLFEPDVGDPEDDPATWSKVHPHLGITVQADYYEKEYLKARRQGAEAMLAFRTKLLNVYSENERRSWIGAQIVRDAMRQVSLDSFRTPPDSTVAIDLSVSDDFSAVTWGVWLADERQFHYHTDYFFPRGALEGHPNKRLYQTWAARGYLHLLEGEVIDYRAIVDHVLRLNGPTRTVAIGYDAYKSLEPVNMLRAIGKAGPVLRAIRQTLGTFTSAVESFEVGIKTGRITLNPNPINAYCFGNAVLAFDSYDNCKPVKRSDTQKIDGVITTLMCHHMFEVSPR